jgi:hypothetical protein
MTINESLFHTESPIGTPDGNGRIKNAKSIVAKFLGRMSQAQGRNFDPKQVEELISRSAGPTDPQRATGGSGGASEVADLERELEDLANAIKEGKNRIGHWSRFFTWITKRWRGKDVYKVEIAKKAFSKIRSEKQKEFLEFAFQAALLPENSGGGRANVQTVLGFCQAADIDPNKIMTAINTISVHDDKVWVLNELGSDPSFQWDNLNATVVKDLVPGLNDENPWEAHLLNMLLSKLPKFQGDVAKQLVLELAEKPKGADCLQLLLQRGIVDLDNTTIPGDVAQDLVLRPG